MGKKGVVVIKKEDMITISNPGSFRIEVESAKAEECLIRVTADW